MENRWLVGGRVALRVLLSAVFAVSAVAKLLGIDQFELYVYSFGLLPLNLCFVLTRLCIGAELLLSLGFALGWYRRWVNLAALAMLFLFSFFLCYAVIIERTDSCQCFGPWVHIGPAPSLLKNAVLIVMVLLYQRLTAPETAARRRWQWPVALLLSVLALGTPFAVSVPDNWMFDDAESPYNKTLFQEAIGPEGTLADLRLDEGHRLVAFVTPGCPYCRMTREKLTSLCARHDIDEESIVYLEPADLPEDLFMRITYGQRPLLILLDEGAVVATYHYRNIEESRLATFLPSR